MSETNGNTSTAKPEENYSIRASLVRALQTREVSEYFKSQFNEQCVTIVEQAKTEIEEEFNTKLEVVDDKLQSQEERLSDMEKWADVTEQEMRNNNMIVRGIKITDESKMLDNITGTLSIKLKTRVKPEDVRYLIPLGADKSRDRAVKIVFYDRRRRDEIYSKRANLKGS